MMKKRLKKFGKCILLLGFLFPTFLTPLSVSAASSNANTLAELRKELRDYQNRKAAADASKARTQGEINASKNSISAAQTEIDTNKGKIEQAKKDIEQLNVEIEETKEKIEELMRSYEITDGDNNYLDYIFNATSISDFIIRYSVSEQLASYNDEMINEFESKISENEQLQVDLANREVELNKKIENLETSIESLGDKLSSFIEEALDAQTDINSAQELIKYYEKLGCGENENFNSCVKIRGDTGFIRPLNKGTITSHYGYRTHPVTGQRYKFHSGTDIGGNSEGTSVYSAASGMVGKIVYRASCGGNQVYIYHTINGVKYTTGYMHLLSINVKVGDNVTNQSVIGTVGGGRGTSSYERCSTGAHLHFMVGKGWYGSTYVSYSTWVSNLQNPVNIVNFPAAGVYFYSRY